MRHLVETVTGQMIDVVDPDPELINIQDIAWSLSRIARFAGHSLPTVPYSVAQHSVFVADILKGWGEPLEIQLFGLLHDAAEGFTGDIISPIKHLPEVHAAISKVEDRLMNVINLKFAKALPTDEQAARVKQADLYSRQIEAHAFMFSRGKDWGFKTQVSLVDLQQFQPPRPSLEVYYEFLERFNLLTWG